MSIKGNFMNSISKNTHGILSIIISNISIVLYITLSIYLSFDYTIHLLIGGLSVTINNLFLLIAKDKNRNIYIKNKTYIQYNNKLYFYIDLIDSILTGLMIGSAIFLSITLYHIT